MPGMTLPPGFRFHPTDEELVAYYLRKKVKGISIEFDVIAVVDLYKCEPWDLPHKSRLPSDDLEWFFFSPRDRKYPNGSRTNRATEAGYWKATGRDRFVKTDGKTIGMKKTLVFYRGRAPHGERTDWLMHEYRLEGDESEMNNSVQDAVLCRVFKKNAISQQPHTSDVSQSEELSEGIVDNDCGVKPPPVASPLSPEQVLPSIQVVKEEPRDGAPQVVKEEPREAVPVYQPAEELTANQHYVDNHLAEEMSISTSTPTPIAHEEALGSEDADDKAWLNLVLNNVEVDVDEYSKLWSQDWPVNDDTSMSRVDESFLASLEDLSDEISLPSLEDPSSWPFSARDAEIFQTEAPAITIRQRLPSSSYAPSVPSLTSGPYKAKRRIMVEKRRAHPPAAEDVALKSNDPPEKLKATGIVERNSLSSEVSAPREAIHRIGAIHVNAVTITCSCNNSDKQPQDLQEVYTKVLPGTWEKTGQDHQSEDGHGKSVEKSSSRKGFVSVFLMGAISACFGFLLSRGIWGIYQARIISFP